MQGLLELMSEACKSHVAVKKVARNAADGLFENPFIFYRT
jgi:hypothetical protein